MIRYTIDAVRIAVIRSTVYGLRSTEELCPFEVQWANCSRARMHSQRRMKGKAVEAQS